MDRKINSIRRRQLIAGLFLGGMFSPLITNSKEKNEKVKMLSQDGKLVEIDKKMYDKILEKKTVSHEEIIEWGKKRQNK